MTDVGARAATDEATQIVLGELVDMALVAELFGVSKATVSQWRQRGLAPDVDVDLATGPIWLRETWIKWGLIGYPARLVRGDDGAVITRAERDAEWRKR